MTTRRYEQRRRAATAEETRRRILDAMYAQLPAMPSVDAVARQAGVARSTIYLVFGSRGGLFDALAQDVLDRGGYADLLVAVRATDPREHLRGGITATARMYAAQRDALAALHALAASTDGAVRRAGEARLGACGTSSTAYTTPACSACPTPPPWTLCGCSPHSRRSTPSTPAVACPPTPSPTTSTPSPRRHC